MVPEIPVPRVEVPTPLPSKLSILVSRPARKQKHVMTGTSEGLKPVPLSLNPERVSAEELSCHDRHILRCMYVYIHIYVSLLWQLEVYKFFHSNPAKVRKPESLQDPSFKSRAEALE